MSVENNVTAMRAQVMQTTETQSVPRAQYKTKDEQRQIDQTNMDNLSISQEALNASRKVNRSSNVENPDKGTEDVSVLKAVRNSIKVLADIAADTTDKI